ncbi:NnrU family protein [Sulfurimonas sp. C5]|uniref:methyltransferase family protein n=1 Tax=Sulfurimonas sp. C5 TaxID=3036947 RepID=UPI002453DF70|nr:NnrU family protein [Sulfurimonas sp. C5]MDH4944239.1 NnrU family protein [Sulfurimonas sp. C5]
MQKLLLFSYALLGYLLSLITLSFLILWVYPWSYFPHHIDTPIISLQINPFVIDIALLLLFALQHSVMARRSFKEKFFSTYSSAFRSATYCIASALSLALLELFWQPIEGSVWNFDNGILFWILTILYVVGWIFAFISTFMIDHFELFGLHQGYRVLKNIPEPKPSFQIRYFYKYVRHPVQLGTLVGLSATPQMSYGHLLLSVGMIIYVLIGLAFEERDLVNTFKKEYQSYQKKTPMLLPFFKRSR